MLVLDLAQPEDLNKDLRFLEAAPASHTAGAMQETGLHLPPGKLHPPPYFL